MAAASSAASTGIEPGERDGIGSAMPTETIESKEMYRGFIALRLATCSTVGTTIKPPRAVDAGYPQPRDLRGPEPCRKAVISAARLFRLDTDSETRTTSSALRTAGADAQARTGSARNLLAERDVEEAQGADDLVEA
jgi:hypothetical protein